LEAGMQRFCKLNDARYFIGKAALLAQTQTGLPDTLVLLSLDAVEMHCLGAEPVLLDDRIVGITTSGAHGMRVNARLALAYVKTVNAIEGAQLYVDLLGQRIGAKLTLRPVCDAANLRLRA
jgi:dimethylglycine dehydrogenase